MRKALANLVDVSLLILVIGTFGSITIFFAVAAIRYGIHWALGLTIALLLFQISKLRSHLRTRDWPMIAGQVIGTFVVGSLFSGFAGFIFGLITPALDSVDLLVLIASVAAACLFGAAYAILNVYFPASKWCVALNDLVAGVNMFTGK